jgi:DNA-binding NtrC family response regulator
MNSSLNGTAAQVHREINQLPPDSIVFGRTAQMQALRMRMERAAASDMPILLEGESGTGKDIIARILHRQSPWAGGVFVKARCSSLPDSFDVLLESPSDFITAEPHPTEQRFESCYGTLFLDEISESSAALQTKLLRLLQEGQLCRINLKRCKLNLRLVCATNCGLEEASERGKFRKDLLYRINVISMRIPPLRERIVDVPELAKYFMDLLSTLYKCQAQRPSRRLLQSLLSYSWPGNIRELENLMKRYVLFNCEEWVCEELVRGARETIAQELSQPGAVSLKEITKKAVRELEREAILRVLQANQWNRKRAACVLNISYRALLYKLKETGMAIAPTSDDGLVPRGAVTTASM